METLEIHNSDIDRILLEYPDLTAFGFGLYGNHEARTDKESRDEFDAEQQELYDNRHEIVLALEWLNKAKKTMTINRDNSSYGLKHMAESYHRNIGVVDDCYISNGAFIAAAVLAGFTIERCRVDSPNAYMNISKRFPS